MAAELAALARSTSAGSATSRRACTRGRPGRLFRAAKWLVRGGPRAAARAPAQPAAAPTTSRAPCTSPPACASATPGSARARPRRATTGRRPHGRAPAPRRCRRSRAPRGRSRTASCPRSRASSTASDVGAPTPTSTGAPATAAFCTSSKLQPAADAQQAAVQRQLARRAAPRRSPCPSRCGGRRPRARTAARPPASNSPVACSPPVRSKPGWRSRSGSAASSRAATAGPGRPPAARAPRPPRARPCRTRRTTTSCRSAARPGSRASGPATSTTLAARSSVSPAAGAARHVEQPLAYQEAERQLLVVARRAHGDRQRLAVHADLERLLHRDLVGDAVALDLHVQARHLDCRVRRGRDRSQWANGWTRSPDSC